MPIIHTLAVFSALCCMVHAQQAAAPERKPDVPFVPTPIEVVEQMLRLADVREGDLVYDLGCGDGRILIMAAASFHANGVGVDIDADLVTEARERAKKAGVDGKVKFITADLFETEIRPATVVTLYLLPAITERLIPKLLSELKPGTRVVGFSFGIGDWKPQKSLDMNGRRIFLWVIPDKPHPADQ